ncbi:MAG: hypothetical protein PUC37_11640 [Spirochaetales bacterium]|nr:hypothetical protein [Spirochaetales bacterium]
MTSGQKVAFSFLFSLVLFAFAALLLHTSLFSEIEADFYSQSKIQEKTDQLDEISTSIENYIKDVLNIIEKGEDPYIKNASVRSYYVQNPSEADTVERRRLTEKLFYDIPELKGIRIVDRNARIIHFSTFDDTDILTQNGISKTYKNYPDVQKDADILAFDLISKNSYEDKSKVLFDSQRNEIIISIPFYWIDGIYSGAAIFYIDFTKLKKSLADKNLIAQSQNFAMISDDQNLSGGFITNFPDGYFSQIKDKILDFWKKESDAKKLDADASSFSLIRSKKFGVFDAPEKIAKLDDSHFLVIINSSLQNSFYFSGLYSSELFELTDELKLLIYISTFITIFLVIFLIFSFKRNPELVLQKRVKKLQLEIIEEYLEKNETLDFYEIVKKLKSRKADLSTDILKSLNVHSKKKQKKLDLILDQSWEEIFSALGNERKVNADNNSDKEKSTDGAVIQNTNSAVQDNSLLLAEIRKMLDEVLTEVSTAKRIKAAEAQKAPVQVPAASVEEIDDAEELDAAEPIEELDDAEPIEDAEAVEDVENLEDAEPVEELDDAEPVEDAEAVEDVENLEDAEPVEDLDDAEPIEDAEEVEDVEDLGDAEPVEELDNAEPVEDIEATENAEDVEDLGDAEPVEELDDAEPIEEAEEVEDVEDLEEVEELEEAEENVSDENSADENFKAQIMALGNNYRYEYHPGDNDSYFPGEDFATVENLFAEPLGIGTGYVSRNSTADYDFTVFIPPFLEKQSAAVKTEEELEVLSEVSEVEQKQIQQKNKTYFSLTGFAQEYEELDSL